MRISRYFTVETKDHSNIVKRHNYNRWRNEYLMNATAFQLVDPGFCDRWSSSLLTVENNILTSDQFGLKTQFWSCRIVNQTTGRYPLVLLGPLTL
ncbi:hypothetical protein RRG08_006270 [Elysia crispata]|uniref:Uncharacterized protein n=1 Tax=Elysia crispata TaxID=231223 RepID=A0AAE1D2L2_9GAST|nr:hypothetical protein RRG08_006270 [Elysia crispata]